MAILKVAQMGHPVLREIAAPVDPAVIGTPAFQAFIDDMLETMEEYEGAGLAAPQVHISQRVVVLELASSRGAEVMINPEIELLTDEHRGTVEGCLSVEGMRARVWRPNHLCVRFLDREGEARGYELKGFAATVVQHECDHLDGVLFVDRCDTRTLAFMPEYRRFGPLDGTDDGEYDDDDDDDDESDASDELSEGVEEET